MSNLDLWESVQKTDPKYTKEFNRGGGFKGTAINPTWLSKMATDKFGPIGIGWGLTIEEENYVSGAPLLTQEGVRLCDEVIHVLRVSLWYNYGGSKGSVTQFGQTAFVGRNKNGLFTDEEAPKKSLTDAMSKCLSLLGFASDVYLGLWDDHKYVNERRDEAAQDGNGKSPVSAKPPPPARQAPKPTPSPSAAPTNGTTKSEDNPFADPLGKVTDWPAWIEQFKEGFAAGESYLICQDIFKANELTLKSLRAARPDAYAYLKEWMKKVSESKPKDPS